MAVALLITLTTAAIGPVAVATKEYSPSPRQVADAPVHGVVVPNSKRGSNAHDAPGATSAGATNVCIGPTSVEIGPNIRKVRLGRTGASPTFCTTTVLTRPIAFAFFAAYGPYTEMAPPASPLTAYATGSATEGASLWTFSTTATGCADVMVTA